MIAHDGFTLNDLVSYNSKHNEANGEENMDGSNDNFSWNCGVEGPTDDGGINHLRQRQMRNLMLALLLAQGTPMILSGQLRQMLMHVAVSLLACLLERLGSFYVKSLKSLTTM